MQEYDTYRVLVTDDQESITGLVERVVRSRLGCEVVVAEDGDQALARLEAESFDVMVTDMMMPGVHGFELLRQVQQKWPEMNVIVMTGYPADFPYVEVMQDGADDFLNKPFPHAELEAKLMRLFRERELRRQQTMAQSKYKSLFELSLDGMVVLSDGTLDIVDANQAFRDLCGLSSDALIGQSICELFDGNDKIRLEQWITICARSGRGVMGDLILLDAQGRKFHVDVTATFIETEYERIAFLAFKDMTEKREVEQQLAAAAERDELTGLFNKRSFQNRIEWAVNHAQEKKSPLSLLVIDLDNFKHCNDTYGHPIGDKLLISVGSAIAKSIRASSSDEGFRCGGDEFMVLLPGTKPEDARCVAERIQAEYGKQEAYGTTMSIGIAGHRDALAPSDLIRESDAALYLAKGKGKNTVVVAGE